jgi:arylsulfatase A-like enzyme
MRRRDLLAAGVSAPFIARTQSKLRPNILWITCEDLSPVLGCYGDRHAATPNLDRVARQGVRYDRVYASAPVCSPARSCLITGVQANTLGSMHLRGMVRKPDAVRCFPEWLRDAGYYTSNNVKEDYNFTTPPNTWNESSNKAHWRGRAKGQPFFSVFNLMTTHQGQIRYSRAEFEKISASLPAFLRHDPATVPLPPYYPDTPDVRLQMAILYTQVSRMDQQAGAILRELEQDGLAENTIVFFFSDHGTGLPRGKRFLHDSGLRVPFLVRFPEKYRNWSPSAAGTATDRLVSFVDIPPTVLSLAGIERPSYMQGAAFLGTEVGRPRRWVYAARDRVDEEFEVSRTVTDGRWQYIRNYHPHRPVLQHGTYSEVGQIWQELRRLGDTGKLSGTPKMLLNPTKPAEELYDIKADPHQINNLAASPAQAGRMTEMRRLLREWITSIRDTGLLPEADMLARANGLPPYEMSNDKFPLARILEAAEAVGRDEAELPRLRSMLSDSDPAVRYWAAIGLTGLGDAAKPAASELRRALDDKSAPVSVAAAEALCLMDDPQNTKAFERALESKDACVQLQAAAAIWHLGSEARAAMPALKRALATKTLPEYQRTYFEWAAEKTLERDQKHTQRE